jgi:hypothetical protein
VTPPPNPRRETTVALVGLALTCAAGGFSACNDNTSPNVASISLITLASPAVVLGDILRDSTGAAAPAHVVAYDASGNPISGTAITFLALDSTVTIDADGTVHGLLRDSVGARIVATAGSLQTPAAKLLVTIRPTALVAVDPSPTAPLTFTISTTLADSLVTSGPLGVKVTGAEGKAAQGIIVTYEIVAAPASSVGGLPTALLTNDAGRESSRDTTALAGGASRKVTFLYRRATGDLLAGTVTDTIRVRVRARDLGADIIGSPFDFKIPVRRQ